MDQSLVNRLANPTNQVASAFEARTGQLDAASNRQAAAEKAAQQESDNYKLKVIDMIGDGRVDEAKYFAQQKGVEIPDEIYSNGDFAKGLAASGKFYGNDPARAQKFVLAWMQTRDIADYGQRVLKTSEMTGPPIDPNDYKFQQELKMELFKNQLKSGNARQDLFTEATKASMGSLDPDPNAGKNAVTQFDEYFGTPSQNPSLDAISQGLRVDSNAPLTMRNNNPTGLRPVGDSTGFQKYSTPQEGIAAAKNDLAIKISGQSDAMKSKFGENYAPTLANVISTHAPSNENDTLKYIMFVSNQTGIAPQQQLTLQDIDRILPAMAQMEGGSAATQHYAPYLPSNTQVQSQSQPQQQQMPSGLPSGTVMIGTRNGAPVYQSPDGRKFIDDGNP
jgi:hypothetical protein